MSLVPALDSESEVMYSIRVLHKAFWLADRGGWFWLQRWIEGIHFKTVHETVQRIFWCKWMSIVINFFTYIFWRFELISIFLYKVEYGKLDTSKRLDENEKELIDLSCFDENDPRQHQMKLLFGCGIYFCFQEKNEHVFLEIHNFTHGTFPSTHPFSGYEW